MRTSVIKRTLLLALLFATSPAWAGWVLAVQTADGDFYIDPETIRKNGDFVIVWSLVDMKQRSKSGILSLQTREEYDCKEERTRALSIITHSEPMARGEILANYTETRLWMAIPPGSPNEEKLKFVCRKT